MKESEDTLTVIVFRGARANPWRLKIRKAFVKYGLISGLVLLLIQSGIITHYVYQWNQLSELEEMKKELNSSRAKTGTFSVEVDGMKKRMLALETLNRKLQTMFGLEPDDIQGLPFGIPGQGGEEFPYEAALEAVAVPTEGSTQKNWPRSSCYPGVCNHGPKNI